MTESKTKREIQDALSRTLRHLPGGLAVSLDIGGWEPGTLSLTP